MVLDKSGMNYKRLQFRATTLLAALLTACAFCADIPPDVSTELNNARDEWRKAQDLSVQIARSYGERVKNLDEIIDRRDEAQKRAVDEFEKALKKDPAHPQVLLTFGRYWLWRHD